MKRKPFSTETVLCVRANYIEKHSTEELKAITDDPQYGSFLNDQEYVLKTLHYGIQTNRTIVVSRLLDLLQVPDMGSDLQPLSVKQRISVFQLGV